jgi:lipopolysaccharide export system protein LptA
MAALLLGASFSIAAATIAAEPLPSVTNPSMFGSRTDSDKPIEITADTLEVNQNRSLATFKGRVDAVQGTIRLRSDQLTVHYRDNKEKPDQPGISKIEADGNVFISTPRETAQGARGVYDVDRSRIDLFGSVVLTQGENLVRGERLEMNLATGESKITGGTGAGQSDGSGRVKGLFVPEKKSGAPAKEPPPAQKKN